VAFPAQAQQDRDHVIAPLPAARADHEELAERSVLDAVNVDEVVAWTLHARAHDDALAEAHGEQRDRGSLQEAARACDLVGLERRDQLLLVEPAVLGGWLQDGSFAGRPALRNGEVCRETAENLPDVGPSVRP
jgi:hypothetical protein